MKLWEWSHMLVWDQGQSNTVQKVIEIYQEALGRQDRVLKSLLDRNGIGQAPACDGSL